MKEALIMCGRYGLDDERDSAELCEIIDWANRRVVVEPIKTSGEIFPSDIVPVVASSRRMTPALFAMRWGFMLPDGRRVINARSETAQDRPLFRDGMLQRRCAIPATRYFEWERRGAERRKYAIRPSTVGLFYMAGVYRVEAEGPVFSILTRAPAEDIAFIHNRMPVILPSDLVSDWTNPKYRAEDLLRHAVLDVSFEREAGEEQLTMDF